MSCYDIIGDVHGKAAMLENLLIKMGYKHKDGAWRCAGRKAIFLGDLIDRGPEQVKVTNMVRDMQQANAAFCILGNHEFNALSWATRGIDGEFLREHSAKNFGQHEKFLAQVDEGSDTHKSLLAWFRTLPLWLNMECLCVHACWDEDAMQIIRKKHPNMAQSGITDEFLMDANVKGSATYRAVEIVLKGLEIQLPVGCEFKDKDNNLRREIRVKWWDTGADTYNKAAVLFGKDLQCVPDVKIDVPYKRIYTDRPLFVGHYWFPKEVPKKPLNALTTCVDYSAGKDGPLVAYRWNGENVLRAENFVSVPQV